MSAYMVHEEHINVMIWAAVELASPRDTGPVFRYADAMGNTQQLSSLDAGSMTRAGQMLVEANAESMAARYGEHDHSYPYQYQRPKRTDWTAVDVLGALSCYEYQACETGTFETSEAGRFCEALRNGLINRLPGMNTAPWEIGPETAPGHVRA